MHASWATHLFTAHHAGRLNGDELWCLVLECFEHERADRLAETVLRSYASAAGPATPATPAAPATVPAAVEPPADESAADLFILMEAESPAA